MDYTELQDNKLKSSLIKIETLQKEYDVILQQYQEAVKNYINNLQNSDKSFVSLSGRTWWGNGGLTEGAVSTKEECETMCANNDECTGATFNPVKRYCWARKGDAALSVGETDDQALIPIQKAALISMQKLNEKLLSINEDISSEFKNISPSIEKQTQEKNDKQEQLNKSYQHLLEQKLEMEKQLRDYYSVEQDNENQTLFVNKQSMAMRFWVLITAIILLITIRKMYGSDDPPFLMVFWLFIIIILIILTYTLNTPAGFVMWFIIIMAIILVKSGSANIS
jgi:hypothetical protein